METAISRFPEMVSMLMNNEDDEEEGMQIDHEEGEYKWMENIIKIGEDTQRRRIFLIQEETTTNAFKAIQKIRREHTSSCPKETSGNGPSQHRRRDLDLHSQHLTTIQ
jgi:hypothetical protein